MGEMTKEFEKVYNTLKLEDQAYLEEARRKLYFYGYEIVLKPYTPKSDFTIREMQIYGRLNFELLQHEPPCPCCQTKGKTKIMVRSPDKANAMKFLALLKKEQDELLS